ncbi:MAG: 2-hydroxy-6-oxo-6-phenylhexa-2,4-dienoate hydrolase [Thiotrichales bacterium]|nr:2-hydroxy-6-oxo-6-phenylhexa-2,4-dienoate hydrolase [Thiotrichales bacterium]
MQLELSGCDFHYQLKGEGKSLLVLHGGSLDHRHMVDALEPVFAQHPGWERIYVDLPGHGHSKVDESITTQDQVLELLLEFMAKLRPGGRFAVAGESRGGYLARGLIHRLAAQISGALFIVPGRLMDYQEGQLPEHEVFEQQDLGEESLAREEQVLFDWLVLRTRDNLDKIRTVKSPAIALLDRAHRRKIYGSYEFSFDVDAQGSMFGRPSLFLLGRQDHLVGYQTSIDVMEQFPRATLAILDRAGHSLSWEQPGLFNALVGEWLSRVEESEPQSLA